MQRHYTVMSPYYGASSAIIWRNVQGQIFFSHVIANKVLASIKEYFTAFLIIFHHSLTVNISERPIRGLFFILSTSSYFSIVYWTVKIQISDFSVTCLSFTNQNNTYLARTRIFFFLRSRVTFFYIFDSKIFIFLILSQRAPLRIFLRASLPRILH